MPAVAVLQREKLTAAGITVVGVSQFNTSEAESIAFVETANLTFPNLYDSTTQLAQAYGVSGVPSYVFIDRQGRIAHRSTGAQGVAFIDSWLHKLLEE